MRCWVIRSERAPASALTPLLDHRNKTGFVVIDMPDVDEFAAINEVTLPETPLWVIDQPNVLA